MAKGLSMAREGEVHPATLLARGELAVDQSLAIPSIIGAPNRC
jgi:hypothetical protein